MKRAYLFAFFLLGACAGAGDPMPVEGGSAPSAAEIAGALGAAPADVQGLACSPAIEDGCYQCNYTLVHAGADSASEEPRIDMVCNVTGAWTATPMSQLGS